ncbi:MAG: decaprenyl-phosphate phosphoribosyltransferase [Candidatus Eisenbacteria bacterium]|uniref:Decaprenyl-phosphate phosphoribosyltransferase n=1 Tax=Eiseniibacteriota bacterium TaxID=2212470 RepID=A0A849SN53_UNCEI|nr:decaprenyl-phosphate phosphoribosyltransferase [Candidatus Eisenbacteria bacterium]
MIVALIQALRPKQWTKNLLIFAGIVFSRHLLQPDFLVRVAAGFGAFCLLAGSVYMLNDLRDIAADREHPRKRLRPIASGRLPVAVAWIALPVLLGAVAVLARWLGPGFMMTAGAYVLINLFYSMGIKHVVLVDVFVIAIGFVLRAIAGVQLLLPVAPETAISPWLLVCTFFGALFLALAKRRREIANAVVADGQASRQRAVLDHYSPELLEGLLLISAATSLMAYALYTIWPGTVANFGTEALLYTVPFVAYGIFRYLYLVRVAENTEDPSQVLLTDRPLGVCVALYLVTVVLIIYRT